MWGDSGEPLRARRLPHAGSSADSSGNMGGLVAPILKSRTDEYADFAHIIQALMTVHVVQQGECLSSIAHAYGLPDWKHLHDHAANKELKNNRPNPNILAPGDE